MIGRNTEGGQQLQSFIERIERLRSEKKELSEAETLVFAEAKGNGYDTPALRRLLRRRSLKPHVLAEAEAIDDIYQHAMGMTSQTSLSRLVGMMNVDINMREEVIDALSKMVPANGAITVEAGGRPIRLSRDARGEVTMSEVEEPAAAAPKASQPPRAALGRAAPPDVDGDAAEELGREAFRANEPIVRNPFPFGDDRRWRWDQGWQSESGTDGMGKGG